MTEKTTRSNKPGKGTRLLRKHMLVLALSTAMATGPVGISMLQYPVALAAPVVGTSAAVKGKVFVSTKGAERKAQIKESIKLDDVVTTKQDSALQILLLDESTFTVGQNCVMTIDRFVYDPDTASGEIGATVTKGAFRFMSGNIGKSSPTNASVSTPTATIGIRGTFFEGIVGLDAVALAQLGGLDTSGVDPEAASLIILRGPGPNTNSLDRTGLLEVSTNGGTIRVSTPNYAIFDPGNGAAPIGPIPITPEMQAYLDFFLRSTPNGPPEEIAGDNNENDIESGQEKFEPSVSVSSEDLFEELVDGIQDSLTKQFCSDPYSSTEC